MELHLAHESAENNAMVITVLYELQSTSCTWFIIPSQYVSNFVLMRVTDISDRSLLCFS